jgi:hypothetical protein
MTLHVVSAVFFGLGLVAAGAAIWHERLMQRHRLPGVSYRAVTFRRDGGWRRADLFAPDGLRHQSRAARYGLLAVVNWVAGLVMLFLAALGS